MTEAFDYSEDSHKMDVGQEKQRPSILSRLHNIQPERHVVFAAFDILETSEEIAGFMTEYAMHLASVVEDDNNFNPFKVAANDVGTCLGYIDRETFQKWSAAVENLRHPIFGNPFPQTST